MWISPADLLFFDWWDTRVDVRRGEYILRKKKQRKKKRKKRRP